MTGARRHSRTARTVPRTVPRTSWAAAAVLCAALAAGGAAMADDTASDDGNAPPPPTTAQDPPSIGIDMELCVGEPASCYDLPAPNRVPAGSATLTVECVNTSDDDDCADTPFDKASVNGTEKDLVDAAASFDLGTLTAGETRAMEVKIRSSTHENQYSAGINFNIVVQR